MESPIEGIAENAPPTLSSIIKELRDAYVEGDVTPEDMKYLKLFPRLEISAIIEESESNDLDQLSPQLQELQEAAFLVDDLRDLYEYNQLKNQVSSSFTNFIKKPVPMLRDKLACIIPKSLLRLNLEYLLNIVDQMRERHPYIIKLAKTKDQTTQQKYKIPEETTSTLSSPYFGREEQRETIVKLLLDAHADSDRRTNEVPVITIQGNGGSGKTHTAQLICKDKRITNYFNKPIWVHVTADFDVKKLIKRIVESANNGVCPRSTNLDLLQLSLKRSLRKRRFLLVLDDVSCEDKTQWNRLIRPLNEAMGDGSKIIVTTRLEQIALYGGKENIIALDELKDDDCWSILNYYSKHVIEDPELLNVGNQIISKAGFSPLLLKVIGNSLRNTTSVDEWKKILKPNISRETMDLLLFSFQRLPSHLQQCFAYCSLFPKGYTHRESLLVPLWIAQGYIENTNNELTLEEEGSVYVSELLSYSFFEKNNSSDNFVIHDLLHDLAEWASRNLCHKIEHPGSLMNIPERCIHLSINTTEGFRNIDIDDISKLRNMRSIIILDDASCTNIFRDSTDIFQILSKLRAMYVESDHNLEVLSNLHIDELKHLRYLHLQYYKKLPESLTKLYHLQFFNLMVNANPDDYSGEYGMTDYSGCPLKPNFLPRDFGNLINLRTLKFLFHGKEVDYLKHNSEAINIEKLQSLQNVTAFHLEKDNVNGISPLKNLPLCGLLKICDLENIKSKGDAKKAMLNRKKKLNELILQWGSSTAGGSNDAKICEEVLEGLEPHEKLKSLMIKGYEGVKIPNWMEERSWGRSLRSLTLLHCKGVTEINFLPPSLQDLHVERCPKLKKLPRFGNALKQVHLISCPVLRVESTPNNSSSLELLQVLRCPMLMTDKPISLVEKIAERDTTNGFAQAECIEIDQPLFLFFLVQQQGFSSIKILCLGSKEYEEPIRVIPQVLVDNFHEFSTLHHLELKGFTAIPDLDKLSSLQHLHIECCYGHELLPNLPTSLRSLVIARSLVLVELYRRDGPLRKTISHIPYVRICW